MAKKPKTPVAEELVVSEQPYYLQRAHIKDFRSIRDAKVEFKPGLNIIIGANGSGKTNFVRALEHGLHKLRTDFSGKLNLVLDGRNRMEVASYEERRTARDKHLQGLQIIGGWQQFIQLSIGDELEKAENFRQAQFQLFRKFPSAHNRYFFSSLVVIPHGIPNPYPLISEPENFLLNTRSVELSNDEQSFFTQSISSSIISGLLAIHAIKGDYRLPSHEQVKESLEKVGGSLVEKIRPELKRFTPIEDIQFTTAYQIYTNSSQQQVVIKGIILEFKINGDWLPFEALSSGTQRLFYIVSELVGAFLTYSPNDPFQPNENDKIILLEEPELGIHPDQLYKLLLFLREQSEKHQIIITTHSPQVLDMLKEDELDRITICELDAKKGTQFRKLKKAQIATAKNYMKDVGFLSDYWRYGSLEENN